MSIILNETKQANHILKTGELGSKPTSSLFLLGKYYSQKEQLNTEQTFCKLDEFMRQHEKNYNPALWESKLEDIAKKSAKYHLWELDGIPITQSELDNIAKPTSLKYQKLLFTMLCHAKFYNTLSQQNNGWVNTSIPELYKLARVTVKHRNDKFLYLNDIQQTGLISFSTKNDNLNIQINFVDMKGEPALTVTDFRELGYEYLKFLGSETFTQCIRCGRLIKKTNNKCRYCCDCAKFRKIQYNKRYYEANLRKIESAKIP